MSRRSGVVQVKICGVTRAEDALAAESAGADAIAVNLWEHSRRYVDLAAAAAVFAPLGPFVQRVAVFVDASVAFVDEAISALRLGAVQINGDADEATLAHLRERAVVIRALPFGPGLAVDDVRRLAVDAVLIDASRPGSGETFDWSRADRLRSLDRWVLAGGLTPDNVAAAIRALDPMGVDVASGVESAPGVKDHEALRRFVAAAKSAR